MKQVHSIINTTAATVIGIGIAASTLPAYAEKKYDVSDLRGTYNYNLVQIRTDTDGSTDAVPDYCDEFGTLTFDGVERMDTEGAVFGCGSAESMYKCSISGVPEDPPEMGEFKYTVTTDGQVAIAVVKEGGISCTAELPPGSDNFEAPAHAQITDKGRILLIDGTTRPSTDLIFNGVAVEQ